MTITVGIEAEIKSKHRNIAASIRYQAKQIGLQCSVRRVLRDRYEVFLNGAKIIAQAGFHFRDDRWHITEGVAPFETEDSRRIKGMIRTAFIRCLGTSEYRL